MYVFNDDVIYHICNYYVQTFCENIMIISIRHLVVFRIHFNKIYVYYLQLDIIVIGANTYQTISGFSYPSHGSNHKNNNVICRFLSIACLISFCINNIFFMDFLLKRLQVFILFLCFHSGRFIFINGRFDEHTLV